MSKRPSKATGLTFVELLVTLAVASILAVIAFPDMSKFIKDNRNTSNINDVLASLTLARSEAIKRNSAVAICKSANGTACQDSGDEWQHGWIVFADPDLDGVVDDSAEILSVHGALPNQSELLFSPVRVVYRGNGLATTGNNGTFTLCDDRGAEHSKGLVIGASGRARMAVDGDDNGIPEDADGNDLECSS